MPVRYATNDGRFDLRPYENQKVPSDHEVQWFYDYERAWMVPFYLWVARQPITGLTDRDQFIDDTRCYINCHGVWTGPIRLFERKVQWVAIQLMREWVAELPGYRILVADPEVEFDGGILERKPKDAKIHEYLHVRALDFELKWLFEPDAARADREYQRDLRSADG